MQYEIKGAPFPVVICGLNPGETVVCQKGAMTWMTQNMQMVTNMGGGIGKMFNKMLTRESIFQNEYTAQGGFGEIAFGSSVPGQILAVPVSSGRNIVAQKSAFLASEKSVSMELFFQKKIGSGFFGGEGFIMQKFTGNGMLFLEVDGSIVEYDLQAGESLLVDTGYLCAMDSTVSINIETIQGVGNVLFGGEGLFNTKVTGPGHVWLQTMPIAQFANSLKPFFPTTNSN
jgi:uncharacterized protein (TIGR00266 family)